MKKKLTKTKLNNFQSLFVKRRSEILIKVKNSDQELDADGDEVDAVQALQLHEVASQLSGRDVQMIKNIDAALDRITKGTFGLCEMCDESIGEKRLMAMPHCVLCIDCQEHAEFEEKLFK